MKPPSHRPQPRHLSEADRRVWERVARTVHRKPGKPDAPGKGLSPPSGQRSPVRVGTPEPAPLASPGPLEPTAAKAVRRGRVRIDARLDLHDLTLADAYPELARGLIRAFNRNLACVLVITGKGRGGEGKLRAALPGWLAGAELRPVVATYAPAHIRHGGTGAWYVFLKGATGPRS